MSPDTIATMRSRFSKKGILVHSEQDGSSDWTASSAVLARRGLMRSGRSFSRTFGCWEFFGHTQGCCKVAFDEVIHHWRG
jgi:hypothetical protein